MWRELVKAQDICTHAWGVCTARHGAGDEKGRGPLSPSPLFCMSEESEISKLNLAFQVVMKLLTVIEEKDRTC